MNGLKSLLSHAKETVPFHRARAPDEPLTLTNWPLMNGTDVAQHSPDRCKDLLSSRAGPGGYIVASGGTKRDPKFLFYSHREVEAISKNIALHFMSAGMEPGDRVINYFTSGDMWSAFLMVDKALSTLPVTVYPLGYSERMDSALMILQRFKPNVIAGIPSMILSLARYCAELDTSIRIGKVFYGGESLTPSGHSLLHSVWQCELIKSAGYACTDVGSIGWQCSHCETGEHYPFKDIVLEIVDGNIVVTSLSRYCMPIIRYQTGDRGEWVEPHCACGRGAPMFKLLGRSDNTLIIWGCWIGFDDIVKALVDLKVGFTGVQMHACSGTDGHVLRIEYEPSNPNHAPPPIDQFRDKVYELCEDLHKTVSRRLLNDSLFVGVRNPGELARNQRTGKIVPILDSRT